MSRFRYGNSYTLTIVMADGARKEDVEYEVKREFPGAEMKPSHSSTLVFEVSNVLLFRGARRAESH